MPNSSSGRPTGRSNSVRPTLDSERSPSVHYANWKEMMLMERQLTTLQRTEKAIVHGITVDQKVAFRRFQRRLQRSKITNARMWSDKEEEIGLRDAGMRKLHSESHLLDDGKTDFISKLEKRPYTAETKINLDTKDQRKDRKTVSFIKTKQKKRSVSEMVIVTQKFEREASEKPKPEKNVNCFQATEKRLSTVNEQTRSGKQAETSSKPQQIKHMEEGSARFETLKTYENQASKGLINLTTGERKLGVDKEMTTHVELEISKKNKLNKLSQTQPTMKRQESHEPQETPSKETVISFEKDEIIKAKKENEVNMTINNPGFCEAPFQPRNPRNKIRPGQSSFLNPGKPISSTEQLSQPHDFHTASETLQVTKDNDPKLKCQRSFMQTYLAKEEAQEVFTKTKHKSGLLEDSLGSAKDCTDLENMNNLKKRRPIQLRGPLRGRQSLFIDYERLDYCQMRLDAVKRVGYESRVRSFCEAIDELGESASHCDYYASKMNDMVAGQRTHDLVLFAANRFIQPCEQDYRRHTGNTALPCITLKKICLEESPGDTDASFSFADDVDPTTVTTPVVN